MTMEVYIDLVFNKIFTPEIYIIDDVIFFEERDGYVYLHFMTRYIMDELYIRILHYYLKKFMKLPVSYGGTIL